VVAFGLSRVLAELKLVALPEAYSVIALCLALDAWLLYVFFKKRKEGLRVMNSFPPPVSIPPASREPLEMNGRRLPNG
jgi:hypothetical protein